MGCRSVRKAAGPDRGHLRHAGRADAR